MDLAPTLTPYNLMRIYRCKNRRTMWKIVLIDLENNGRMEIK
jgi:hypothetical protein